MDSNLEQLLSALNAHNVRHVVVGGYAVGVHAQPRVTKDLDVFIDSSPENARAVYAALADFGAPLENVTSKDFESTYSIFRIGVPPICVDFLQHIDGVDFESAWKASSEHTVDGFTARYISAEHLIQNKLASGRLQDLADAEAVQRAQAVKIKG